MAGARADVVIVGGGLGGCAAALSLTRLGKKVVMTEETDWVGGQWTAQTVPPDEHRWIESFGCSQSYRRLRNSVRDLYRSLHPLLPASREDPFLNPGKGWVSRLCCEPRMALLALSHLLAFPQAKGDLLILLNRKPISADTDQDRVRSVDVLETVTGRTETLEAEYFLDATELGDLLPLTGTEYVTGAESQRETGEPHAKPEADPENVQSFTWCFALSYDPLGEHVIEKPAQYERWRDYVPQLNPPWTGRLLDWTCPRPDTLETVVTGLFPEELERGRQICLWTYRRILCKDHYPPGALPYEVTIVNWYQNDYWGTNIIDKSPEEVQKGLEEAKQLSLSLLYWLQTEAPRPDGRIGYPGLFLRPDVTATPDGFAKFPYIRESRRIKGVFTVTENHVGVEARALLGLKGPEVFDDTVGVGCYRIDLHPSTGGDNYLDIGAYAFQIPLGALIPVRMENLLPSAKNIATTHISNGCYRLHHVEWGIGEAAGALAAFCLDRKIIPRQVWEDRQILREFQSLLTSLGVELIWTTVHPV